jgi:hypothetical protein
MNTVLSDYRFTTTQPGFTARGLLVALHSPRLQDLPALASWIDAAADAGGISRELLCCLAQKEQSGLTLPVLSPWALETLCGFGVYAPGVHPKSRWRGPETQLCAAAAGLRYLFDHAHEAPNSWYAQVGRPFSPGGHTLCTPTNRATAALYSYTPSIPDKHALLAIWREFNLGDPLGSCPQEAPTMAATAQDLIANAQAILTRKAAGDTLVTLHGVTFKIRQLGRCQENARKLYECTTRNPMPGKACCATKTRENLKALGQSHTDDHNALLPGDYVYLPNAGAVCHECHQDCGHVVMLQAGRLDAPTFQDTARAHLGITDEPLTDKQIARWYLPEGIAFHMLPQAG